MPSVIVATACALSFSFADKTVRGEERPELSSREKHAEVRKTLEKEYETALASKTWATWYE